MNSRGQGIELLIDHGGGRLDQDPRPFCLTVQVIENRMEAFAALSFVGHGLAGRQMAEMADEFLPVRKPTFADCPADERLQDLLGTAPSDAERKFDRRTVDPGGGKCFELLDGDLEPGVPDRFIGHNFYETNPIWETWPGYHL